MNKPRIFIVMHYMEIGGAESSLIGLLEALDPKRVDIDLFIYSHQGVFMNAIPDYVNVLPEIRIWSTMEKPMKKVLLMGYPQMVLARLIAKWRTKRFYKRNPTDLPHCAGFAYIGEGCAKVVPSLKKFGTYDLAISYMNPHDFVLKHVSAKRKIAWIHTDYNQISINVEKELPIWGAYDKIISISKDVTQAFLRVFPTLMGKIVECENMMPKRWIEKNATSKTVEADYKSEGVVTLCSVGRISYAKNYDNIPHIAAELKKIGGKDFKFHWFIVGPGNHSNIDSVAKELGVDDVITFLGPSDNPYPYIKNCDIYVHPSRYEGKSIVVREAQILCKPVIITNYPTAKSQINNGADGIICELDNEKIAEAIHDLATNEKMRERLINYLQSHDNAGINEVEKIYKLIE